jgi:hypothetical protein
MMSFIGLRNRKLKLTTTEGAVEFHDEKAVKMQCNKKRNLLNYVKEEAPK